MITASVLKGLTISVIQAAFLCEIIKVCKFMIAATNTENLPQYKIRFSLIVKSILAFTSSSSVVGEEKNMSPNFK